LSSEYQGDTLRVLNLSKQQRQAHLDLLRSLAVWIICGVDQNCSCALHQLLRTQTLRQ